MPEDMSPRLTPEDRLCLLLSRGQPTPDEQQEPASLVRAQGFNTCSKEYRDANDVSPAFTMFYNASNFDKIMSGSGSVYNDVYCAITGDDADFLVSGDMGKFDYRLDLKKHTIPLLILVGRYGRITFPRWTIQYKRYAPQAQFVMFEKSVHFFFIEETDEAMRTLRDFPSQAINEGLPGGMEHAISADRMNKTNCCSWNTFPSDG